MPYIITGIRLLAFFSVLFLFSCKKFVQIEPPRTNLVSTLVFSDDVSANSTALGMYSFMVSSAGFASGSSRSITILTGLSADELKNYSTNAAQAEFFNNSLTIGNAFNYNNLWVEGYRSIYNSNAILEGLENATNVSNGLKMQLEGEAKFVRAFCHFYLLNLYNEIPLITSTDYRINSVALRESSTKVYQQIISDLKDAQNLLSTTYSYSNGERIRPNKWAAIALLSRVYLYSNDWVNAEALSTVVINNSSLFSLLSDINSVFKKNSNEAIWQLMPVLPGINTNEGSNFILTAKPTTFSLNDPLLNSFETGDLRKGSWIKSIVVSNQLYYFPYKYQVKTGSSISEYSMVLRLAEQYLIRAEARAQQGNFGGAKNDLNEIRTRAGLPNTTATDKSSLLLALEHERQCELFTEWGHRWLDLKRTNRASAILAPLKGSNWQETDVFFPIPQSERNNDQNLSQNAGY
jgi:starch-binding outer membrane protein, SusD/RagB family